MDGMSLGVPFCLEVVIDIIVGNRFPVRVSGPRKSAWREGRGETSPTYSKVAAKVSTSRRNDAARTMSPLAVAASMDRVLWALTRTKGAGSCSVSDAKG